MIKVFQCETLIIESSQFEQTDNGYIVDGTWYQITAGYNFEVSND